MHRSDRRRSSGLSARLPRPSTPPWVPSKGSLSVLPPFHSEPSGFAAVLNNPFVSAKAANLSRACCVKGGTLPSGGSTISDVRLIGFPGIGNQYALYARPTSVTVPGAESRRSRLSRDCCRSAVKLASSSAVSSDCPSNRVGRSRGVLVSFAQTPCKSGSPQGVRNVPSPFDVAWADAGADIPITTQNTAHTLTTTKAR